MSSRENIRVASVVASALVVSIVLLWLLSGGLYRYEYRANGKVSAPLTRGGGDVYVGLYETHREFNIPYVYTSERYAEPYRAMVWIVPSQGHTYKSMRVENLQLTLLDGTTISCMLGADKDGEVSIHIPPGSQSRVLLVESPSLQFAFRERDSCVMSCVIVVEHIDGEVERLPVRETIYAGPEVSRLLPYWYHYWTQYD